MAHTFENALIEAYYALPTGGIIYDGQIHRFGKKHKFWYVAYKDRAHAGDWAEKLTKVNWFANGPRSLTPKEHNNLANEIQKYKEEAEIKRQEEQKLTAKEVQSFYGSLSAEGNSEYLLRKALEDETNIRFGKDQIGKFIAIPLYDMEGFLWNIQKIYDDGQKRFFKSARKKGCFYTLFGSEDKGVVVFCEGYATGSSIHASTGHTVVVCFDAGNIEPVVKAFRDRYPESKLIIAGDNDIYSPVNIGHKYAREAGNKYDCKVIFPAFKNTHTKPTDFNDLACLEGLEAVRDQLNPCFAKTQLKAITALNFVNRIIPPRRLIMSPFLPTQGLCMIYAPRGMGKTYLTLSIAFSIAQGEQLLPGRWHCDRLHRVLYVDGEMCQFDLQERMKKLIGARTLPCGEYLKLITPDMQEKVMPDIATQSGRESIEEHLDGVEVLILDNLSALCREGKENEGDSWVPVQQWLLKLRRRGLSVILVHHANKNGGQRGTSRKEDLLDSVIALKRPGNYNPMEGARFEVQFEKARGFYGKEAEPFILALIEKEGTFTWEVSPLEDAMLQEALVLKQQGKSQRDIAKKLGCSASTVNRMLGKQGKDPEVDPTFL